MEGDTVSPGMSVSATQHKGGCARFLDLLKIHLNEGVTYGNLVIFFLAVSFGSIALLVFADASVALVLENVLHVKDDIKGTKAGQVVLYSEILIAGTIWAWGMLSDRIGRRWVFAAGTLFIAASFAAMPFVSSFIALVGVRLVFAPGAAAASAMLMALICDYPRDDTHARSRGKASAIMGVLAGLGALFAVFVLMRIPVWMAGPNNNPDAPLPVVGIEAMFFSAAGVAVVCGFVSFIGLAKQLPASQHRHAGLRELITSGFRAMADPYVVLAYLASFGARAASSVVSLFLNVWILVYASQNGISKTDAIARAGEVNGIVQVVALLSAPVVGLFADKVSRAFLTFWVSIFGIAGYLLVGLLSDPFHWSIELGLAVFLLGVGEMGMLIMSQSILGLHAPNATRGSISGLWAFFGSLGVMFCSGVGGPLFDLNPGAPFFIFAAFNFIVSVVALVLYILERRNVLKDTQILETNAEEKAPLIVNK